MKFTTLFSCALFALSLPALVFAGPVVRSGNSVSVSAEQVLENDFYGFGGTIAISGEAKEDVCVIGNSITVNAPVSGDLAAAGASVQVHATAGDDVRVLGGTVLIASEVSGDVVVLGGTLKILSTAKIGGDVLFFGNVLDIEGAVAGSVYGRSESARIDSPVGGDVRVRALQRITLGDKANIAGSVAYSSVSDLERAQNASVGGEVTKEPLAASPDRTPVSFALPLLMGLFTAIALFLLFRERLQMLTVSVGARYGIFGLVGFGITVGIPIFAAILMVSVIGSLIGIALLLTYILFILAAWVLTGAVCGTLLLRPFTKTSEVTFLSVIVGTLFFMLIWFIPIIGPILALIGFLIVLGGLGNQLFRAFR